MENTSDKSSLESVPVGRVKPTKAERDKRISEVEEMLILGQSRSQIVQYCSKGVQAKDKDGQIVTKGGWGVTTRCADKYIAAAHKRITRVLDTTREQNVSKAVTRLERQHSKAMAANDYLAAKSIQAELNKLLGLNAPTKYEVGGDINLNGLPDAEFAEIAGAMAEAARARAQKARIISDARSEPETLAE